MSFSVEVHSSGPIFDGRSEPARKRALREILDEAGRAGQRDVLSNLGGSLRHPTGYYESHIRHDPDGAYAERVHDDNVIYGPWLEGTGSRNAPVTVFPGYFSFRRASQQLDREIGGIADRVLTRRASEIG
jgi:hypothetical protein